MAKSADNSISFGVGLLIGVLAGVATGVLFSPRSGEEMRKDLKEVSCKVLKHNEKLKLADTKLTSLAMMDKLKYSIEKQISRVGDAIKAGKMAAAKQKEELEAGYNY